MTKASLWALMALVCAPALVAPALAQDNAAPAVTTAKIGYLGLQNDVRYHPQYAYTRIEISPAIHPVEGARLAIDDMKIITDAANIQLSLDEQKASNADNAIARLNAMAAAGERFAVVDLPGDVLAQVAPAVANSKITLINATAPQDLLRELRFPKLLHAAAFDRLIGDAYC